tara:strand:- start:91821 stop:92288 length:468 start_codon:yes stop_codon:yes gene_type:complete
MSLKNKLFYVFILIGILGVTPICFAETSTDNTSIAEVKKETKELLQALRVYTVEQREEAIRKTKTALDNLDKRIDSLQARIDRNWEQMDSTARDKARSNLDALRKERTHAAEWYGSMKSSTSDAWEHMKKGFSKAYSELNDAWEKSAKEFNANKE